VTQGYISNVDIKYWIVFMGILLHGNVLKNGAEIKCS
jgi:hypothetical protein